MPRKPTVPLERVCRTCDRIFLELPYIVRKGRGIYCSRKCVYERFKKILLPDTKCKICGSLFRPQPFQKRAGNGKFCSLKCVGVDKHGARNPRWNGGESSWPYAAEWTETLRVSIRERDGYACQLCGSQQCGYALDVHHKDEDKQNCNPTNLITLCRKCHVRHHNKRRS